MTKMNKYGSKISITYESLHQALGLPEETRIIAIHDDGDRDTVAIKLHAEKSKPGVAYAICEGMEYPEISIPSARRMVNHD